MIDRNEWDLENPNSDWEWETRTHEVYVYGLSEVTPKDVNAVVGAIEEVVRELKLPLSVKNGNSWETNLTIVTELIANHVKDGCVNFEGVETELRRKRDDGVLPHGLVILLPLGRYMFNDQKCHRGEKHPALYGCGSYNGLVVLLRPDLPRAAKHEFGHMIGLDHHNHKECTMDWSCSYDAFCSDCRQKSKKTWEG
jgi:hypothetical protein